MMEIRVLRSDEIASAFALAWEVFRQYTAVDYTAQGVQSFHETLQSPAFVNQLECYGAFEAKVMIGMAATCNHGTHIALLFVNGGFQKIGVGKRLVEEMTARCPAEKITVNAAPSAAKFYSRLGFVAVDTEQERDGIRYIPMTCQNR